MADKRRLRGQAGGVFVPHPLVDEATIAAKIKAGEWSELEDAKPKTLDQMKVDELKAHAAEKGIDLGDATKKDDIRAVIEAERAAAGGDS